MPIEPRYNYIDDLDNTSPRGQEPLSDVDDHLKGVKSVLKTQWPNLGDSIVTPDAAGLSSVGGRVVGYGGMSRNNGTNQFNVFPNVDTEMTAFNSNIFGGEKVIATPSTGRCQVTGMNTLGAVYIHASLSLKRVSSGTISAGRIIRAWVKRVSDQSIVKSAFALDVIPDLNEVVQFTLEGVDPDPLLLNESYVIVWNHGGDALLSVQQTLYNFWIEPAGT